MGEFTVTPRGRGPPGCLRRIRARFVSRPGAPSVLLRAARRFVAVFFGKWHAHDDDRCTAPFFFFCGRRAMASMISPTMSSELLAAFIALRTGREFFVAGTLQLQLGQSPFRRQPYMMPDLVGRFQQPPARSHARKPSPRACGRTSGIALNNKKKQPKKKNETKNKATPHLPPPTHPKHTQTTLPSTQHPPLPYSSYHLFIPDVLSTITATSWGSNVLLSAVLVTADQSPHVLVLAG